MKARLAAALLATVAAGAPAPFTYDSSLPFHVRTLAVAHVTGGVTVREISFAVTSGVREKAFLVLPATAGPHPGIVFYPGRGSSRDWFRSEAIGDARRGVVSLSLDDLSVGYPSFTLADRRRLIERVVTGLRAVDLLAQEPGVDTTQLGYVGHSDGAEIGGIVAGIDHRLRAVVLMSGGGSWDRSSSAAYDRAIGPLDGDNWVGHAAPGTLFFQNALSDQYVSRADGLDYQAAGRSPKKVAWYAATHVLNAQAERDRQHWLERRLGF